MTKQNQEFHGSDLEAVERAYGIKKEDIISFSANVNPLGISPKLRENLTDKIDAITSYPDRDYTSLRKEIASYSNVNIENIIVGNGATELISLFIKIIKPKNALVVGPTYSEYERELNLEGGQVSYHQLEEEKDFQLDLDRLKKDLESDMDLLIICNPNNPTSSAITNKDMEEILKACKKNNIFLMVDETYVEFVEDINKISSAPLSRQYDNIIVLRGISKFFAAPGLRLGYGICGNKDLINEINRQKNPWSINSLAAVAGEIMFTDEEYIKETRRLISTERERIYSILASNRNVKCYKPSANFMLVKILKEGISSRNLFQAAIKEGYMIRDCSTFPFLGDKFIRFCFMSPEDNDKLIELLVNELE